MGVCWLGTLSDGKFPILEYIREQKADILCLQEASTNEIGKARVDLSNGQAISI